MASKPRKSSTSFVLRLIGSLASVALLAYLLHQQGWNQIADAIRQIAGWRLALVCVLMFISRLATGGRWHVLLRGLKVGVHLRQSLSLTFAGLFAANFLPTTVGGDIARLAGAMQLKYDGARCAASLVLDRLVGMIGMLVALPFGLPAFGRVMKLHRPFHASSTIVLSQILTRETPSGRPIVARVRRIVKRLLGALLQGAQRPYHLLGALVFTWIHMLCFFSIVSLLLSGMGEPMSFGLIAGLWTIVYFVTLLPISVNGLGVQELSVTYVYTHMGISPAAAITVALLMRTLTVLASLPGAAFVPSILAGVREQPIPEMEED